MRIKMPCSEHNCIGCNRVESNGNWSNREGEISFSLLQKFWSELPLHSRKELLKVDKQMLFEQARKNMYCSRCNGLLLEFYMQILAHGKSMAQVGSGSGALKNQNDINCLGNQSQDDIRDPALCPWGGLTATRDGSLTLLDRYLCPMSLKALQNVFDSARARERERELLYPDGCGGGGRGWISQGVGSYGRGSGTRETCALHTARFSCNTFVDFWSALGEETQHSLLRMKEEDFVERLMYRFDSKRFCRDCRKNVIREFKELKELKRSRRAPRCTSWFCVADSAFQYEVSDDMVQAEWGDTFGDSLGIYHHFEWAVGTGEGKSDILDFENVGTSSNVCVDGLDLCGLNACYITLRAWRSDGYCNELSVKAHALRGIQCVHSRLLVGDGYISITCRGSIRKFFEHAEEADDEEDDESMERDENNPDRECSRPQRHAKSPELAREFLLDAATVIFKEQIEKAFREGTARQNAHIMFISLALQLLEERLHVACKEIITLEKQTKLLEEEEREKREEKERKERRKAKEREKKQRRKERLRGKERGKEKSGSEPSLNYSVCGAQQEESVPIVEDHNCDALSYSHSSIETVNAMSRSASPDTEHKQPAESSVTTNKKSDSDASTFMKDGSDSFSVQDSNFVARGQKHQRDAQWDSVFKLSDRKRFSAILEDGFTADRAERRYCSDNCETPYSAINRSKHQARFGGRDSCARSAALNYSEKIPCSSNQTTDNYDGHSCKRNNDYRAKEAKSIRKLDMSKQSYHDYKYARAGYMYENRGRTRSKFITGNITKDSRYSMKVWEPLKTQEKYQWGKSDSDFTITTPNMEGMEGDGDIINSSDVCSTEVSGNSDDGHSVDKNLKGLSNPNLEKSTYFQNGLKEEKSICYVKETSEKLVKEDALKTSPLITAHESSTSDSDNSSLCLSEGDSSVTFLNHNNTENSSTSDTEDANQLDIRQQTSRCMQNGFSECHIDGMEINQVKNREQSSGNGISFSFSPNGVVSNLSGCLPIQTAHQNDSGKSSDGISHQPQVLLPQIQNPYILSPMFQAPSPMGYYLQPQLTWPAALTGGLLPLPPLGQYLFTGSLGYGLNGNSSLYMQPLQDLVSPLSYPVAPPVYQAISRSSGITPGNQHEICKSCAVEPQADGPEAEMVAAEPHSAEALSRREDDDKISDTKHHDNSFSLFHFGCHAPLSVANKLGHVLSQDEIIENISAKFQCCHSEANKLDNNKEETKGEEYNLFAASNGIEFSLF